MCNGLDGLVMTETWQETAVETLEYAVVGLDRPVGHLVEHASHHTVAFGGPIVLGYLGGFLPAGTDSHPGGELRRGGEGGRPRTYFGNYLLSRIDPQSRHGRETEHPRLVLPQSRGCAGLQGRGLPLQQFQPFQKQAQDLTMKGAQTPGRRQRLPHIGLV